MGEALETSLDISGAYLKLLETEKDGDYSYEEENEADVAMKFATNLFAEIVPYLWM